VESLIAVAIGVLVASGVYLVLRPRTFSVVLGLVMLSYAVNLFLVSMGRFGAVGPPLTVPDAPTPIADPLPQALVLTAIVIGFGMTALFIALAVRSAIAFEQDHVDGEEP
jgi:multicomponent K+:H+ antiporter subunit C